ISMKTDDSLTKKRGVYMFTGMVGGFYNFSNWIMRFAYVNFLWIIFTLAGLIIFGVFPATIAMFAIVRKWIRDDTDIPVFKTFWLTYKKAVLNGNILGLALFIIGFILYVDFIFLREVTSGFLQYMYYPLLLLILLFSFTALYIFPVIAHYEMTFLQVMKNAFFIMIMNPPITLLMVVSIIIIFYFFHFILCFILLCSVIALVYVIGWLANVAFVKIQRLAEENSKEV